MRIWDLPRKEILVNSPGSGVGPCISQDSPEKQNQQDGHKEREIYFKGSAHAIVEAGRSKIRTTGWAAGSRPTEEFVLHQESESSLEAETPLPQGLQLIG